MNALWLTHQVVARFLKRGGTCIDATAGRGYDTAFLCELAGDEGSVTAFDIQQEALDSTRQLLEERGLRARLILDSHENMAKYFESESIDVILFNLGYLPKGDHAVYTRFESTRAAIESGLGLLKRGGLMSVCIYYGGDSGYEEKEALIPYLSTLDDGQYQVLMTTFHNWKKDPPIPVFIIKQR